MKIIVNHCKILTFAEMSLLHDETLLRFLRNKVVICQGNDGKYVNYADFEERVKNWLHNEIGICCMEYTSGRWYFYFEDVADRVRFLSWVSDVEFIQNKP